MTYTASQLAEHLRGELAGDGAVKLSGMAPIETAQPGDLVFAEKEAYLAAAVQSQASAILASVGTVAPGKTVIHVASPRVAMARALALFFPPDPCAAGIDPTAVVHPSATIDPSAQIGPHCRVGANARIGARSRLAGGNDIGMGTVLGDDVTLFPNVVIYHGCRVGNRVAIHAGTVIGSDGYGYVFDEGRHRKVPQVGNVVIHDDVEIGANAAIDRGALGSTVIGQGTKIDNLVHIAHNVVFGRHCLVMGQAGFAGSTHLADYCVIASQSGVAGHLKLGVQATVGAKSGVMRDVPDKGTVLGIPAMPDKQTKRQWIAMQQLPELIRQVRDLEKQVQELRGAGKPGGS